MAYRAVVEPVPITTSGAHGSVRTSCWLGVVPLLFDDVVAPLRWERGQCLRALAIGPAIVAAAVVASDHNNLATLVKSEPFHGFAFLQDLLAFLHRRLGVILAGDLAVKQSKLF